MFVSFASMVETWCYATAGDCWKVVCLLCCAICFVFVLNLFVLCLSFVVNQVWSWVLGDAPRHITLLVLIGTRPSFELRVVGIVVSCFV